ncbi:hypothetical protein Bca4012_062121 [Brassica carinata]
MVIFLGSHGRRVVRFVPPEESTGGQALQKVCGGGSHRRVDDDTLVSFGGETHAIDNLCYWSGYALAVKTHLSVQVYSRFMAKERIHFLTMTDLDRRLMLSGVDVGWSPALTLQSVKAVD